MEISKHLRLKIFIFGFIALCWLIGAFRFAWNYFTR